MTRKTASEETSVEKVERLRTSLSAPNELVTVVLRKEDYAELKKIGGPRSDQVHMALRHYLSFIGEGRNLPAVDGPRCFRGNVINFQCSLQKDLCEDIRRLGGRFDSHTIEAFRLFLL